MARYSIDGQILTDIADYIREKKYGGNPVVTVDGYVASTNCSNDGSQYDVVLTPPVAGRVKVTIENIVFLQEKYSAGRFEFTDADGVVVKVAKGGVTSASGIIDNSTRIYPYHCEATFTVTYQPLDENDEPIDYSVTPVRMVAELNTLPAPPPSEAFIITDNCNNRFANNGWSWFLTNYSDQITTIDITQSQNMFNSCNGLESIPFELNFADGSQSNAGYMFAGCSDLKEIAPINNLCPSGMTQMFQFCSSLRYLPEFNNFSGEVIQLSSSANLSSMFSYCYSLRSIPESFLKEVCTMSTGYYSSLLYNGFQYCYALEEIRGLRGNDNTVTSNMFNGAFTDCFRLKDIIFATNEDGTPRVQKWKSQTIDLTGNIGVATTNGVEYILNYNSGITADKEIKDQKTYDALKNDPDAFVTYFWYSLYNHDSAVRTINSLPDTSAYLASAGGTNTIKFSGGAGKMTDEGGINTLTEAEIAIAAAKGWTVSIS